MRFWKKKWDCFLSPCLLGRVGKYKIHRIILENLVCKSRLSL